MRDHFSAVSPIAFDPGLLLLLDELGGVRSDPYPWERVVALQGSLEVRPDSNTPHKMAGSASTQNVFATPDGVQNSPGGSPAHQGYMSVVR
jgi:hypothetical protein